jgi:hypothetical protein
MAKAAAGVVEAGDRQEPEVAQRTDVSAGEMVVQRIVVTVGVVLHGKIPSTRARSTVN